MSDVVRTMVLGATYATLGSSDSAAAVAVVRRAA